MATREELYSALRNADAAGDAEGARKIAAYIQQMSAVGVEPTAAPAAITQPAGGVVTGTLEPLAALGSSVIAAPVAGLAGLGASIFGGEGAGARTVESVQNALTYQPRTKAGENVLGIASYPFEKIAQGADYVGGKTADLTGSPALGAGVNAAIQFAPAALLKLRGVRNAAPAATPAQAATQAAVRARQYVASRTGLDWNSLSGAVKQRITDIAKDAKALDKLDPKALATQAQLESLPAPVAATKGQLTRDVVQLRNEGNVSATEAGKPVRDIYVDQNRALLKNLDILKGKVSGSGKTAATAATPEQVGLSVQDTALRAKADLSKKNYDKLYRKARETEPDVQVAADPLHQFFEGNPEVQHLGFLQGWLKKSGIEKTETTGGIEVTTRGGVTLNELDDLRKKASGIARSGGTDGYYAGQVVDAIDQSMSQVPEAAKAWKAAQQAFKKHKMEFEEQGAVDKLVSNKSRTDRSVALEDTWRKTVLGGSIEDLEKVKRSLLTGGDSVTRTYGKKAWRDMRAQTIQHIKDEATKGVARMEDGSPNVTPASMQRAINSIGADKLESIFGDGTVKQLNKIMEATRTVKTEPPPGFKGSSTFANALAFLERGLTKIPLVGDVTSGAIRATLKLREMGAGGRQAREAARTPLSERNAQAAESAVKRKKIVNTLNEWRGAGLASQQPRTSR